MIDPNGQAGTQDQENIQPSEIEITPEMIEAGIAIVERWEKSYGGEIDSLTAYEELVTSLLETLCSPYSQARNQGIPR